MGEAAGKKYHQAASPRRYVELRSVRHMHAQGPAITVLPIRIEIGRHRDATAIVIAKTIQVRLVERAWRIQREMAFELFKAQKQGLVEAQAQLIHQAKVAIADGRLAFLQPLNMIAADALANFHCSAAPDCCRSQFALGLASAALCRQFEGQISGQKGTLQRPAALGQVINDGIERQISDSRSVVAESNSSTSRLDRRPSAHRK